MPKQRLTRDVVQQWSMEHLHDKDPTTFNRYRRIAGLLQSQDVQINRLLSENGRLQLECDRRPLLAHRAAD